MMVQTTESCFRDHPNTMHRTNSAARRLLAQPEMGSVLVAIIVDVIAEQSFQVSLVEHDHIIE